MPAFSNIPRADLALAARTLYLNARDDAEISADLTPFGYTAPDDYDAGIALVTAFEAATAAQSAEYADQYAATDHARQTSAAVEARYSRHRQAARLAHRSGTDGYAALHLAGSLPDARADLLDHARIFYQTLEARADLLDPIRGIDRTGVTDALALVTAALAAAAAQTAETGEAQRATVTANTAETDLRAHAAELAAVARLALADKPQLREKLGLLERS